MSLPSGMDDEDFDLGIDRYSESNGITQKEHADLLYHFFLWFRENGQKYMGLSIEQMIEIYLKELE
jgi:hypothetical protein